MFWSYLWGFETSSFNLYGAITPSFGVTYEGLKRNMWHKQSRRRRPCFGVTYEGLKHVTNTPIIMHFRSFGVTYEGLKPRIPEASLDRAPLVLELPMRVWNRIFYDPRTGQELSFGVTYEGLKRHVIYLPRFSPCFGVTEGLKLIRNSGNFSVTGKFWSYLWGFETLPQDQCRPIHRRVLELPMRVWNLYDGRIVYHLQE